MRKLHTANNSFITKKQISALNKALDILGTHVQVGGSMSLLQQGFITRPLGDFDLIVPNLEAYSLLLTKANITHQESIDYDDEIEEDTLDIQSFNGEIKLKKVIIPNRVHFEINNVKFCIFKGVNQNYTEYELNGRIYKICNSEYAIEAKRRYVKETLFKYRATSDYKFSETTLKSFIKHVSDIDNFDKTVSEEYRMLKAF